MRLKYYMRGLGVGILISTVVLFVAFRFQKVEISDEEVIQRAKELGMVMDDSRGTVSENKNHLETEGESETETQLQSTETLDESNESNETN